MKRRVGGCIRGIPPKVLRPGMGMPFQGDTGADGRCGGFSGSHI